VRATELRAKEGYVFVRISDGAILSGHIILAKDEDEGNYEEVSVEDLAEAE